VLPAPELKVAVRVCYFCTLAHITYPYRYFKFGGREHLLALEETGRELFEDILKTVIDKGISLEVNTSGLRQGLGQTLPNTDLIKFYKELGGELITVGSDAHHARDLGADIKETAELLKSLGFKYITRYKDRKPYMQKLN
jgi:histidinol-phosphatase (PHP family)